MKEIVIKSGNLEFKAEIYNTLTGLAVLNALPFKGKIQLWGKEAYFDAPMQVPIESDATEVIEKGGLAIWPTGGVFCIFWGPTPISINNEPRAISPVNIFGKIKGDLSDLNKLQQGATITVKF